MRRSVRLTAAAAAVAVVGLVGACGGSNHADGAPTSAVVRQPAGVAANQGGLTSATFVDAVSTATASSTSYDFAMTLTADGETAHGQGSGTLGADPSVAMTIDTGEHGTLHLRLVDGKAYVSLPALTGSRYFAVDPAKLPGSLSSTFDQLTQQTDPAKALASIDGAVVSVTKAGAPVQLDGVAAQPYDVTVDTSKLPELREHAAAEHADLPATVTFRYWVGPDDLLRKLSASVAGNSAEVTFSHWGAGAPVTAPSADQIAASPF